VGGQMSKKDEYKERLKNIRWVQWQIVRRHEDYINFCDKQAFNKEGVLAEGTVPLKIEEAFELVENPRDPSSKIINPTIAESELSRKAKHIKKRFFLNIIFHYSKNLSEGECLNICGWRRHVHPIWPESENFNPSNLPHYGDYIYIGINIAPDVMLKDIKDEVLNHVRIMRHSRKCLRKDRKEDIKEKITKLKGFRGVSRQSVEPLIKNLQGELVDNNQSVLQTTPGKDQGLNYYKALFKVWDLHIQRKSPAYIIKEIWPEKWGITDFKAEEKYYKLITKYQKSGFKDYEERAFQEAYTNKDEHMNPGSCRINLFTKIYDYRKRMKELFDMFPNT
jgi:hypothetical protein